MEYTKTECSCSTCTVGCYHRPGFFAPGEAEEAAKMKGLTLKEFFDEYLVADYYLDENNIYILAPANTNSQTGTEAPMVPTGTCIFLEENKCSIHEHKPAECAYTHHDKSGEEHSTFRDKVVEEWKNNQEQIEELLGRKPIEPEMDFSDMLGLVMETFRGIS